MGEPDRAIAALQKLLSIPGQGALPENVPRTPALLRLDPMFDSLGTIRVYKNSRARKRRNKFSARAHAGLRSVAPRYA